MKIQLDEKAVSAQNKPSPQPATPAYPPSTTSGGTAGSGGAAGATTLLAVTLPPGMSPGQKLQVQHNGQTFQCPVPAGVKPGGVFHVSVPSGPPAGASAQPSAPPPSQPTPGSGDMPTFSQSKFKAIYSKTNPAVGDMWTIMELRTALHGFCVACGKHPTMNVDAQRAVWFARLLGGYRSQGGQGCEGGG